jgi:hypothetical protein
MKNNSEFYPIEKLQRVSAPPFLYTKIKAKIEAQENDVVSFQWVFNLSVSFVLLIIVNVFVISSSLKNKTVENNDIFAVAEGMSLSNSSQLYYE